MKEKIGMEKLIELLNEYHHFNSDLIGYFYDDEYDKFYFRTELPEEKKEELKNADALIDDGVSEVRVEDERIISKKFGFIKWLVENDKIDIVKVYKNLTNYEIEIRIRAVKELLENNEEDTIAYLKLLMLLSIQDEPIRFLCEIIK